MSSSSAVAGATRPPPSERTVSGAPAPAGDTDPGEPIADLPPLIEPTFAPIGQRPARRHFLAPSARSGAALAVQVVRQPPHPVEPVAAAAPAPPQGRWSTVAPGWWPRGARQRIAAGATGVAVICLIVAAVHAFGVGAFSPARQYPVSAAPSDPAQRLAYFQSGARAGDPNAELRLAILYAKGEGVTQDYAAAATWFRAAADHGVARAQFDLGVLYERGRGVAVDLTAAANWYLKAAQQGHPLAQYNLAVRYTKGQGIREDLSEAALWYRRAAAQGVVQAMITLGNVYEKGEGVDASPVDAYAWYLAAGRRGNQSAARRAENLFNGMTKFERIHAEGLASDVATSIHDPQSEGGEATAASGSTER